MTFRRLALSWALILAAFLPPLAHAAAGPTNRIAALQSQGALTGLEFLVVDSTNAGTRKLPVSGIFSGTVVGVTNEVVVIAGGSTNWSYFRDILSLETIADLASWTPGVQTNFVVLGYRTPGDWGGPRFGHYDPTSTNTPDGGCVFATSTGTGRNLMDDCESGVLDVTWFGADPTGTLGSSAAIQAATREGINKVVTFPTGVFLIDTTITNWSFTPTYTNEADRTVWRGQTKAMAGLTKYEFQTILRSAPGLNSPIVSFGNPRHVAITGIAFDGDRTNQTGFTGNGLVELVGGWGALESDLTDVVVFESITNGIYVIRSEVQFERVKSIYNDGDGLTMNEVPGDPSRTIGDSSFQNVQIGFNKGTGMRFNNCYVMRMYNVDTFYNNGDGISITGGGLFRAFGLQANNNGGNGLKIGGNNRDLMFTDCLFYDSNWNEFENYSDPAVVESTNPDASGTYHNLNIVGDGNNLEVSFIGSRFWSIPNPGSRTKKVGYLLYDGHPAAGAGLTFVDAKLIDSTNHWDLGIANGAFMTNAAMIGVRYNDTNAFTRFAEPVRRTVFSDDDFRGVVSIARSDPSPHIQLYRPDTIAWATMDLGKGYFRQYANEGIFEFGNTNSASAGGMPRVNYLTLPNHWSTNANALMLSGISRTNDGPNDVRIGGGGESFDAFNRILFFTATNYTGSTGGIERLSIQSEGQLGFVPLTNAPTLSLANGQVYFDVTNGLTQRRASAWEKFWTAGNDGAGSTLDADTLDGFSSAAFATVAGTEFTGDVTLKRLFVKSSSTNAITIYSRTSTTNYWVPYVPADALKLFVSPGAGGYDAFTFNTNGSLVSVQGTFWNSGNAPTSTVTVAALEYSSTNIYDDLQFAISDLNPTGPLTGPTIVDTAGPDGEAEAAVFNTGDVLLLPSIQMSHRWRTNTTIFPHLHVEPQTADAITNTWVIRYAVADIGQVFPSWTIVTNTIVIAGGQQWKHLLMSLPTNGIPMTGKSGPSTIVRMRATLTSNVDTYVIGADAHFQDRGSPVAYVAP